MNIKISTNGSSNEDLTDEQKWLSPDTWPTPMWHDVNNAPKEMRTYADYYTHRLRTRYTELENDFRSVFGNYGSKYADKVTGGRIVDLLHSARSMLETEKRDNLTVSSVLDLIERYMVWLYPPHIMVMKANSVLVSFDTAGVSTKGREVMVENLTRLTKAEKEDFPGQGRSLLDEAIATINRKIVLDQISSGLQIERLNSLRSYGLIALILFFLASPLITNANADDLPAAAMLTAGKVSYGHAYVAWLSALGIMAIGGIGGFLSALLYIRGSRVSLSQYLESKLKAQLRPIVGALVALMVYILLSWQIIPGVKIENGGSYIFFAFLSGFSERYFLKLLEVKSPDETVINSPDESPKDAEDKYSKAEFDDGR